MLWPAESIYDGTWGSGPPPDELVDFEIMREMKLSWQQLQETPLYVRQFTWDLMLLRRQVQRQKDEAARRSQGG